jgi:ketosteroid isomerase-like protein
MNEIHFQEAMQASAFPDQADTAKAADAVRARTEAVVAAESAKDAQGTGSFFAEEAVLQANGMPQLEGRKAITAWYAQAWQDTRVTIKGFSSTVSTITVAEAGDIAWASGINRFVLQTAQGELLDVGKYQAVWKHIDGEWYISALAFSSDAPAPLPVSTSK